jgi:NAD(P)-dependent dehydrogenase (short-subunit alcohol dehydrogenase family)
MTAAPEPLPVMPTLRLDGQRALVTGAGRGIGLAAAAALAEAGAHVTLAARTAADVEAAAAALRSAGRQAESLVLDVRDTASVRAALADREPCDVLVNNAGGNQPGPFVEATEEAFDAVMGLNVRAAYFVAQAFVRRLVAVGRPGAIINVSSQMGHVGAVGRTIYCTSKHALEGLTKALAVELAPHGIRVNSICPTFIETAMTKPYFEVESFRREVLGKIKLGRLGRPEDLMGAVVYLASPAAALVTGAALLIDGGWTAE